MSQAHKELLAECEVKLRDTQMELIEVVKSLNVNAEFFSGQLVEANLTINLQAKEIVELKGILDKRSNARLH